MSNVICEDKLLMRNNKLSKVLPHYLPGSVKPLEVTITLSDYNMRNIYTNPFSSQVLIRIPYILSFVPRVLSWRARYLFGVVGQQAKPSL